MLFHPLAEVMPLIEGVRFAELIEDIRDHGLHESITTLDDLILDGRNRYRACLMAGVEPRFEPFTGSDPVAFVASKNLHRRHLKSGQRAMVMAKYATLSKGNPHQNLNAGIPAFTVPEAAAMAGVNKEAICDAHTIRANGTPGEIAAVVNGTASISTIADNVRARRDCKPFAVKKGRSPGCRVKVPAGKTLSEVAREGLRLEEGGVKVTDVAKQIGLGLQAYMTTRDALLLSQRDDLSRKDADAVAEALHEIDAERQVGNPRKVIEPIASRVWGSKGSRLKKADQKRAKQFDDAIEFLLHTCENAIDMVIPQIKHAHAEAAMRQLVAAEASLRKLRDRIREVQYGE